MNSLQIVVILPGERGERVVRASLRSASFALSAGGTPAVPVVNKTRPAAAGAATGVALEKLSTIANRASHGEASYCY
jgi:hypothetical protein